MSEVLLDTPGVNRLQAQERTFEQHIFALSPFGTGLTTLLIFLILALVYGAAAKLSGWPIVAVAKSGLTVPPTTRDGLVLSLLIATALGMQRYARLKDIEEARASPTLAKCFERNFGETPDAELSRRLWTASIVGIVFSIAMTLFLNRTQAWQSWMFSPVKIWFALTSMLLAVLFTRGLAMTRMGGKATGKFIQSDLKIDLLRIDELSPLGKSAARVSLIWFSVSAVSCLSLVGGLSMGASIALILVCAGIGIAIFVLTMSKVHRRIKAAKASELSRLRTQMDCLRHELHANAEAAMKLQGLIAYEDRIEKAPEWPFDQTTAMRLGASALILTVPWFGQALAQTLVDRVGQIVH